VTPSDTFDQIREEYYRVWFRFHPETAVDLGVAGHAHTLTPAADEDIGALITLNEKLLVSLEELDCAELDDDRRIDYDLMAGAASLEIEELIERDWRTRDPQRFLPVNAIHQLTIRDVPDFAGALLGRLRAIPGYLREARQEFAAAPERVPRLWLESAVEGARRGVEFLRALPRHDRVQGAGRQLRDLPPLIAAACDALLEYARFLEHELEPRAAGDFACGRQRYMRLLQELHFLEVSVEKLHAFGLALADETSARLEALPQDRRAEAELPAAGDSPLGEWRRQMQEAREFVRARDLVSWPGQESLSVVETPVFLRHQIPFAAYVVPTPRDARQHGWYYVTPQAEAAPSRTELMHTCVHEAYPGHHLQFVTAHRRPESSTWPRLTQVSAMLYEGWALYCEQLMWETGFLEGGAHERVLLEDRLWRALRIVIDTGIQALGMDLATAERLMSDRLGFTARQIRGELTWYSRAPAVPMGYATGWALIVAARERLRATDPAFTFRSFHDRLLSCGSIGLPLVLKRAFGAGLAVQVQSGVFGGRPDS
jgi:uncharacterized protein (DUF885 family)